MNAAELHRERANLVSMITPETFGRAVGHDRAIITYNVYMRACAAAVSMTPMPAFPLVPRSHAEMLLRVWLIKARNKRDEFGRRVARMHRQWQH